MSTETILGSEGKVNALIIRAGSAPEKGIRFFTENEMQLQVACMVHPAGHKVAAHRHKEQTREVFGTPEVLFIKSGMVELRMETATGPNRYLLHRGDVVVILNGAHALEIIDAAEMWEVKQGPHVEGMDKVPFTFQDGWGR